jgi:hypothetical protein
MSFKIPRFRMPARSFEHDLDLDDILQEFDVEDILKVLAQENNDFPVSLADFIESFYEDGMSGFVEKFKKEE